METLNLPSFEIFDKHWALLTAGSMESHNAMTISWGGLGTLWGKKMATVYVKPIRYTYEFMEKSEYFTVSFYPEKYREALTILGTKSGRGCDKLSLAGFTAVPAGKAVTFEQAELTLVCKKLYYQDLELKNMPADAVKAFYTSEAPHRMYLGEVVDIIK